MVARIQPQVPQAFEAAAAGLPGRPHPFQKPTGALALADLGAMDQHRQDQPEGIHEQVALAAVNFLDGIVALLGPPFFVVLTD